MRRFALVVILFAAACGESGPSAVSVAGRPVRIDAEFVNLDGRDNRDLNGIEQLRSMEELSMDASLVDDSLSGLSESNRLRVLSAQRTPLKDLSVIGMLSALEELYIAETQVDDLSPLRRLRRLRKLDISFTRVQDLRPLGGLALESLVMAGIDPGPDLSHLPKTLRFLRLSPKYQGRRSELESHLPQCEVVFRE